MRFFLTILTFISGLSLSAQLITVLDANSGEPVEGAKLVGSDGSVFQADPSGALRIDSLRGDPKVSIFFFGYETYVASYSRLAQLGTINLEHDQLSLDEIVVSANRWEQNKSEVPNRITAIRRREIFQQNPQTAADLLAMSGEVFVQKSQYGGGSPMIRGFSTNRLLYTVDGVRMNTAIFRSGNLHNVISLDPLAMERSEVIFGPGSVIYGSDAIGGVMNFYTLEPQFSADTNKLSRANVFTRYASASNEFTGHLDFSASGSNWASVTSVTFSRFGDLRMGKYGPEEYLSHFYVEQIDTLDVQRVNTDPRRQRPSGFEQAHVMQKFKYRLSPQWEANYGFHYSTTSNFPRYDRLLRSSNGQARSAEWYYGPQQWLMHHLWLKHNGENLLYDEMNFSLAYQSFVESRHQRDFQADFRESNEERVGAYSLNLDFEKGDENPHRFFYGAEFVFNTVESIGWARNPQRGTIRDIPNRYPQAEWMSYGAYLSYEMVPSPQWAFHAGTRYTGYSLQADFSDNLDFFPLDFSTAELDHAALTGNLGAVYSPTEDWKVSLNLSTGFRAPNVDDIGKVFDSEPGAVVVPNADLKAEYAYNAELGVARVIGQRLKLDLTGYYTWLDDALVRRNYVMDGRDSIVYAGELSQVQAVQNAAQAWVYGVQAGARIKLPLHLLLSTTYSWQKGVEETQSGDRAPSRHAAPAFGNTHLVYQHLRWRIDLYSEYSAEVAFDDLPPSEREKDWMYAINEDGEPYAPSWYTLNLKTSYQASQKLQFTAGVENFTNRRYKTYSSGLVAPGLNLITSVRITL